jgi:ribosome biogenesis protein BRX1
MFRVLNVHTVAELKCEAHRVLGARNVLVFDRAFEKGAARRVHKALLTRVFSVPSADPPAPVRHALSFAWLDGRIWLRVYRVTYGDADTPTDIAEIGPRLVMKPVRIIASGFGGAVLHEQPSAD